MDFKEFIKPELLVLIPVLYVVGIVLKQSPKIKNWLIPYILGGAGILLSIVWILANSTLHGAQEVFAAVFSAITQGVLTAAASVYVNQVVNQATKKEDKTE